MGGVECGFRGVGRPVVERREANFPSVYVQAVLSSCPASPGSVIKERVLGIVESNRRNMAILFFTLVVIMLAGSVWVMYHMNANMMPTPDPAAMRNMP